VFVDKPIIQYPIAAAREAGLFDRIIASTDDRHVAEIAREAGAEIPFERPAELANDYATTAAVLTHAIQWLNANGPEVTHACGIYATAPFLRATDLRAGFELLRDNDAASVVPVATFESSIYRALEKNPDGTLRMLYPEHELTRTNDLPETFRDSGQFYWLNARAFLKSGGIFGSTALPLILPRHRVHDLDTMEDWETAERYFSADRLRVQQEN
ncbi:MAG: pseudaminic acid cytidylyltransferase, partial [Pseudomonadota bacterium]|nr:pseudaminic acid cytidylyltransferase [Pseudomonadota bacterium]